MDVMMTNNGVLAYIEEHCKENINHEKLANAMGFSYRRLREVFAKETGTPLGEYISQRKLIRIAYEMQFSPMKLTDLVLSYGYGSYDAFARGFQKLFGVSPSRYRKENRNEIVLGFVGVGIYAPMLKPARKTAQGSGDGIVLYGVPKVEFMTGKMVPFLACLESALQYMGNSSHASYQLLMAASCAAFRLRWNETAFDPSNVDIRVMNVEDPEQPIRRAFAAAGREYWQLETREEIVAEMQKSLERGKPVIAFGVLGPEACLITGIQQDALVGWSYFQSDPEFGKNCEILPSGYFKVSGWQSIVESIYVIGKETEPETKDILDHIIEELQREKTGEYLAGQAAYDGWRAAILQDEEFDQHKVLPELILRMFCENDAEGMITEGRYWGAKYLESMGLRAAAKPLEEIYELGQQMMMAHASETEGNIGLFCKRKIRERIAELILQAKEKEKRAIVLLKESKRNR